MNTYATLKQFPKIELHCHLDGSLRPQTVHELALAEGLILASQTLSEIKEELIAPEYCDSLDTYLKRFSLPNAVMQTALSLERVSYELVLDAAAEGVKYIEIRFAPQLHTERGLDYTQILESVIKGLRRAESEADVRGNFILSYMRNTEVQGLDQLLEAGIPFLNKGVVAVDLCAGERDRFSIRFKEVIKRAKGLGYRVTIHAGETGIAENVIDAVTLLGAERIGHGVAIKDHQEAYNCVKQNGVCIESCPTSNVQTKAVKTLSEHPIDALLKSGVQIMVNTDNRTVSDTTMTHELEILVSEFGWGQKEFEAVYKTGVEYSFADESTKTWLLSHLL